MNRAKDTRPPSAYHPLLPLNTSAPRTKFNNHHHAPSIVSPLTPSSTTSTTAPSITLPGRAPWPRSRAATTNNTHCASAALPASYKDEFSCYTPTSPVPTFPPPSIDDHDSNSKSNNHVSSIKVHTSKRSRTQTSAAASLYSPLPTSTSVPLLPLTFTTIDNNIQTNTTTVIDTTLIKKVDFHTGHQQPHDRPLENAKGGVASHRYASASILPSLRYRSQSTSSQHQQLPSPLPSPIDSSNDSPDVPPPPAVRARTTSLHHNLQFPFLGQGLATASLLTDFPLPPVPVPATTGVTGAMNMLDGKVMPWLQEAMQTVTMLESRLQELEEDCKAIPLYEQDRLEMIQEIRDLDAIVQQDQGWMDHAEIAVQWTTFVLENALISSTSASHTNSHNINGSPRQSTRTKTRTGEMMPGLGRNTRSERMLPSLVAEKSSTLGNLSSPSESRMGTGAKRWLSESSDVDPSQPGLLTTSTYSTSVDNTDTSRLSSASLSTISSSSLSPNNNDSSSSSDTVAAKESQEAVYRNAIMVALRYLKTIDIAPSLSSVSSSSSKASTKNGSGRKSTSRGHGSRQEQEKGVQDAAKQGKRRTRTRTRGASDRALKEWLKNSSTMSLVSNIITEELLHEDEDEEGERVEDFSVSRVLATVEDMDSNRDRNTGIELDAQAKTPELQSPSTSSSAQMRRCRQLLVGSLSPLQKSTDATPVAHTTTQPNLLPISTNTSTETLSHALNSAAATISGSSQSLNSTLSPTFIDERVFLKQHILHLDKLRVQELNRHQKIEEGHQQLVRDLRRFSKELLGSVNELTCARAALDEASELALLALGCLEKGTPSGGGAGSMVVVDMAGSRQKQQPDNVSDENSMATTTTIRQKRLVAASRKELKSSGELTGECITRIRQLAADCVGITELAGKGHHYQQKSGTGGINASFIHPALNLVRNAAMDGGEGGEGELQRYAFAATVLPLESKATPLAVEMFVDGITFQEFEDHLASIRSPSSTSNSVPSEPNIFKRTFPSFSSSSARLTANNTKVSRRKHPSTTNTGQSEYMRKVLAEDIYPCLLINHHGRSPTTTATVATKQSSGWMSAFLSSSSTQSSTSLPPLQHGINNNTNRNVQGQWVQRLLKAMEANACEIEAWKPSPPPVAATTNTTTNAGSMLVANRTTTAAAPKTACCLCGSIRPCEFRLRLLDPSFSSSSTSSSSSSTPNSSTISSSTRPPQQHQYHALDRFCRERIVAVCDFFMFLAHLRQGLLNQPTSLELFRRALGLRQRMAYARIGSMDLVGRGGGAVGGGGGGGGGEASFYVTRE